MGEFIPGGVWLDTNGKRIQAHGGSVICLKHVYYWYGENKEKTDGKNGIWHWGVRCYKSSDLYNGRLWHHYSARYGKSGVSPISWKMHGQTAYHLQSKRKKIYLLVKIMEKDGSQSETILEADDILGPYQIIHTGLRPLGMSAGDFDLAVAEDGKAYYYFERVHSELICADLTEDYTNVTGYYSTHFPRLYPPFVREAPAHFMRNGKHYLITSGTTGYYPNPSEVAVADTWHGPYRELGLIHRQDEGKTSFHSQISSVFKVEGKRICILRVLIAGCRNIWIGNMKTTVGFLNFCFRGVGMKSVQI